MSTLYITLTILFIVVAVAMILIILVQRPAGGGLAGAFGGAGGGGTEGVFGGRVGDALTVMTVVAFSVYLILALVLNANIWAPDRGPSAAPTATETLLPMSAGEPGFGDEPVSTEGANPTDAAVTIPAEAAPPPALPLTTTPESPSTSDSQLPTPEPGTTP